MTERKKQENISLFIKLNYIQLSLIRYQMDTIITLDCPNFLYLILNQHLFTQAFCWSKLSKLAWHAKSHKKFIYLLVHLGNIISYNCCLPLHHEKSVEKFPDFPECRMHICLTTFHLFFLSLLTIFKGVKQINTCAIR